MKITRIEKFSIATLAIAVSMALASNAYAKTDKDNYAVENENKTSKKADADLNTSKEKEYSVSTKHISNAPVNRANVTQSFTTKTMEIMTSNASAMYLKNILFATSSTFPKKLITKLNENPWRAAPNSPVSQHDMSCFYGIPSYREPSKVNSATSPVEVTANNLTGALNKADNQVLTYSGDVVITQGDKKITSKKVVYSDKQRTLTTQGDSVLSSNEYTVYSSEPVEYELDKKVMKLKDSSYQMNGSVLNGDASEHVNDSKQGLKTFKNATLSGCPIGKRSWHLYSSSISMQDGDSFGSAWNDVFFMGPVPVFYTPYANFPITNKRKSGLLPISLEYKSGSGFSYSLPIYLNLATNYDATVTPQHDAKHGNIYDLEFRYLPFSNLTGKAVFTYIPNDTSFSRVIENDDGSTSTDSSDHKRWFLNLHDNLSFLQNDLNFTLDYSKVRKGDYTYLSDISQSNAAITDSSLIQSLLATYNQDHYDFSAELRKYQNMYSTSVYNNTYKPFAMLPQIKATAYDTAGRFRFKVKSEFTNFTLEKYSSDDKDLSMNRLHLEPSVYLNAYDSYGTTVDFGATGYLTHYNQSDLKYFNSSYQTRLGYSSYSKSVDRALYLLEARAKTTLERKVLDMNHTQTLEPEIKYMYIPYTNQNDIPLYDTTYRFDDYYTLFSPHYYAGIDRIANLNTVVTGFTSRLLDSHDREQIRFSLGQAYNIEENKVMLYQSSKRRTKHTSPFQATLDAQLFSGFTFHASAQYEPENAEFNAYNTAIRYKNNVTGFMAGISYRFYRNGNYLVTNPSEVANIDQVGFEASLPLNADWKIFGASYRDLQQNYNIDSKFGIRYEDCCYAVSLLYEDYLKYNWNKKVHESDKLIGLNIEFKGLYEVNVRGINDPHGTGTHFIPSITPSDLNR